MVPAWIAASGWAGYAWGNAGKAGTRAVPAPAVETSRTAREPKRDRRAEEDAFTNYERLLAGKETDIWKSVSRLPEEKVPEALRRLKEWQAVTASRSSDGRRLEEIESALYFHWADLDPQAALAAVAAMPDTTDQMARMKRGQLLESVLAAWMRTDANGAYRAVKDHKDFNFRGRDMLVQTWTPENVFKNLEVFPDKRRDLLGWYCALSVGNDVKRNAMLEALKTQPDMKDRDTANFMLFRSWGYEDFNSAVAEAQAQKLSGTIKQLVTDNLPNNPWDAMPWAARNGFPPGGPLWERGYSTWLMLDGAAARSWFAGQASAWENDGHSASVAGLLAEDFSRSGKAKDEANQTAAGRQLMDLMERWKSKDPKAAAKWLDTAPPSARELLTGKGGS